jgi:hypothetical protein
MKTPKPTIKKLDLKTKNKAEILTLENINKSLWAKKFDRLCNEVNWKVVGRMKNK